MSICGREMANDNDADEFSAIYLYLFILEILVLENCLAATVGFEIIS